MTFGFQAIIRDRPHEAMIETKVLIADALPLFSEALAVALRLAYQIPVFQEYPTNGPQVVETSARLKPDVALVDYWMPDMEGPILTRAVLSLIPDCKVVLTAWMFGPPQIQAALDSGVTWFIPKDAPLAYVADSILRAAAGEASESHKELQDLIGTRVRRVDEDLDRFEMLAPREVQVLVLLNAGRTITEIAKRLSLTPKTVRNYASQMLIKTRSQSQIEAVAKARACGFLRI